MGLDDSVLRRNRAMQEMLRIARAIVADDQVSDHEARMFRAWLDRHPGLAGVWPVTELRSILGNVLEDGKLSDAEREALRDLLARVGGTD